MASQRSQPTTSDDAVLDRAAPTHAVAARTGVGLVSPMPWRVRVMRTTGEPDLVRVPLEDVDDVVGRVLAAGEELSWATMPQGLPDGMTDVGDLNDLEHLWQGTAVAVDLLLDDGTRLSDLALGDQYGGGIGADAQGAARRTWVDQWNLRRVRLDAAEGRTVTGVEVVVRASADRDLVVFVDAVQIAPARDVGDSALERVRTTRGSHASGRFSRGNTAPLVGLPHGRLYAVPVTDASSKRWVYSWHEHGRDGDPHPAIQGFATSHIPSPWIGDRGAFLVMPSASADPALGREERALPFDHAEETDSPHVWRATLAGGIETELTAGVCAMALRTTFPAGTGTASFVVDHRGAFDDVEITHADDGALVVQGLLRESFEDARSESPPHHVHLRVPGALGHRLTVVDGELRGSVQVDASAPVVVLVGLSTLDRATAGAHVAATGGFDDLVAQAAAAWSELLATVEIEGATDDQQVALASGLYRLFLYPTRQDEPMADGSTRWRSPYGELLSRPMRAPEIGDRGETGSGRYSATNGFWDTYRTAWPLLGLLTPQGAGEAAQGFVAHHLDSGWMPRWSAPHAVDCMTGTTSDTVLADLAVKGTPGVDLRQAWHSALDDASVPPDDERVGRKGLHPALFRGWVASDEVHEGMSWTLDAALNDWSASRLGRLLAADLQGEERRRVEAEAEWLERRSLLYATVHSADHGFFVGREADGSWRVPPSAYDPDDWGEDYTETNAWGTAVTVPHDGAGLARLLGGEAALGDLLDRVVARPETGAARHKGSYGHAIHEMTEARDCRQGMVALSNQPAHHIPFMYMHAGRHDDAHALVHDALDRLFVGTDLGQGFPGDEDNGEMSAWWIFGTIGLYPLVPASGSWVLLPPRVDRTVIRPAGAARPVEIVVTNAADGGGRYIRSVTIDGEQWHEISVPHERLADGALVEIELSPEPTGWARGSRPPSASQIHGFTEPLADVTAGATSTHPALTDDVGADVVVLAAGETVEIALGAPRAIGDLITVTLDDVQPLGWRFEAQVDGDWRVLDERAGEPFARTRQTRVFRTSGTGTGDVTALRFTPDRPAPLRQLEVFAP